jgi:hypothetical protein
MAWKSTCRSGDRRSAGRLHGCQVARGPVGGYGVRAMNRLDDALESLAPLLFILIGVGMIILGAVAGVSDTVAVAFAVLGTVLVVFGGLARVLEGPFEIGTQKFKGQLAARAAAVLDAAEDAEPPVKEAVNDVVDYLVRRPYSGRLTLTQQASRDLLRAFEEQQLDEQLVELRRRLLRLDSGQPTGRFRGQPAGHVRDEGEPSAPVDS